MSRKELQHVSHELAVNQKGALVALAVPLPKGIGWTETETATGMRVLESMGRDWPLQNTISRKLSRPQLRSI